MIMEGKHAELGQGIFISDIQEGSVAEQSGLFVGDIILAVNGSDFVGVDYEHVSLSRLCTFIIFPLPQIFSSILKY
jgi:C-terminal processing protease CtpA/Prc